MGSRPPAFRQGWLTLGCLPFCWGRGLRGDVYVPSAASRASASPSPRLGPSVPYPIHLSGVLAPQSLRQQVGQGRKSKLNTGICLVLHHASASHLGSRDNDPSCIFEADPRGHGDQSGGHLPRLAEHGVGAMLWEPNKAWLVYNSLAGAEGWA